MFVCLSVSPLVYLKNRISKFYDVFCTCYDVTCGVAGSAAPPPHDSGIRLLRTTSFVGGVMFST